jgi:hypothetical protein
VSTVLLVWQLAARRNEPLATGFDQTQSLNLKQIEMVGTP